MARRDVDVSVVSSGHDVADARLHRIIAALLRAGLSVELIGLGDPTKAPPGVSVRTRPERSVSARAWDALTGPWRARGAVVVVVDPDAVPAASLRHLAGRRVVVDVHEDYGLLAADRSWSAGAFRPLVRAATSAVTNIARHADLVVVADDHLPPLQARERMVVRNLPDFAQLPTPGLRDRDPRALYIGDVRRSRGLFTMLETIEAAQPWTLDIVGPVASADHDELMGRLATGDLGARVRLHGRLPPAEAWERASGAWLGLSMLDLTPAFVRSIPSKLYEYLACGLPVLATPLPRQAELLRDTGAGCTVESGAEAGELLRAWAAEPHKLNELRDAAVVWSDKHRAETSAYDLLADRIRLLAQ